MIFQLKTSVMFPNPLHIRPTVIPGKLAAIPPEADQP